MLFDLFFVNPDFKDSLINYLVGTYEQFRNELVS